MSTLNPTEEPDCDAPKAIQSTNERQEYYPCMPIVSESGGTVSGPRLITRILISDIADKKRICLVPSFEILACQIHKVLAWILAYDYDVLLGNISYGLVLGACDIINGEFRQKKVGPAYST